MSVPLQGADCKRFDDTEHRLSVEHFKAKIEGYRHQRRAKFRTLGGELLLSPAYLAASPDARLLVTYIYSIKLETRTDGPAGGRDREQETRRRGSKKRAGLSTADKFSLTCNELMAAGIKKSNAGRARREAWDLGFIDTIRPGNRDMAGEYAFSERWRRYPDGDHRPVGQDPPGTQLYAEQARKALDKFNAERKRKSFSHVNSHVRAT